MKQHTAELLLLITVMIWGSSYVGLKEAGEGFTPFTLITLRFGIAFLFATLIFYRSLTGITRRTIAAGAVLGFLLFCVIAFLLFALPTTPTTTAGFLGATIVVLVPVFQAIFFRKIPGLPLVTGIILALIGIAVLTLGGETLIINFGAVLCLASAAGYALQILAVDAFLKTEKPLTLGILQFGFTALFGLVFALIFAEPMPNLSPGFAAASVLYLAIFCTMIAFLLQIVAQNYTTPEHTCLIFTLESVFAALFGFLLLNEVLTPMEYFGVILILSGVLIAIFTEKKQTSDGLNRSGDARPD